MSLYNPRHILLAARGSPPARYLSSLDWSSLYIFRWSVMLLGLSAAGLLAFIALADEVLDGETHAVDEAIILALRDPGQPSNPIGYTWFEELVRDVTALGGTGVLTLITLAVVGFLFVARAPRAALALLLAVGGGMLVSSFLKLGFDRPRPDLVPHGARVYTASFPSGHSMMAAVVYLTLGAMLARVVRSLQLATYIIGVGIVVTLLIGASRVYLGVHWPTDVLAGWLVGSSWALLCSALMLRLQLVHAVEEAIPPKDDVAPPPAGEVSPKPPGGP